MAGSDGFGGAPKGKGGVAVRSWDSEAGGGRERGKIGYEGGRRGFSLSSSLSERGGGVEIGTTSKDSSRSYAGGGGDAGGGSVEGLAPPTPDP